MKKFRIAIVGATGLVGSTLLSILAERDFPVSQLHLVASKQSAGKILKFKGKDYSIEALEDFDFKKTDIAFFCIGNALTAEYAPIATKAGNVVIDKSHHYRNHPDVPLIIPEVNPQALSGYKKMRIIASPNCNTIPIAVGLKPIYDAVGIKRITVATYQSVSGTGKEAVMELREQTQQLLDDKAISPKIYTQQIAFNVLPHIDEFHSNGYTREEMKIVWEMQKIYGDATLAINPTAVRVPVICGHAASVTIETERKISAEEVKKLLATAPGIQLSNGDFPYATPVTDAAGQDAVYVGRIRDDISCVNGLNLWIVADNLRKGAALNAVQIAEHLIDGYL